MLFHCRLQGFSGLKQVKFEASAFFNVSFSDALGTMAMEQKIEEINPHPRLNFFSGQGLFLHENIYIFQKLLQICMWLSKFPKLRFCQYVWLSCENEAVTVFPPDLDQSPKKYFPPI